jgi:hypothetical protein
MKEVLQTWRGSFIVTFGILFFLVPGLIYFAVMYGKRECPNCSSLNNCKEKK